MMSRKKPNDKRAKLHPHIVIGKTANGLVSIGVTHSVVVKGLNTVKPPQAIDKAYMVDTAYERKDTDYMVPFHPDDYEISNQDRFVLHDVAKKTKVPLK